jgi:hypothetical protein
MIKTLGEVNELWWIFGTELKALKMIIVGPYKEYADASRMRISYGLATSTLIVPFPSLRIGRLRNYIQERISYLKSKIGEE